MPKITIQDIDGTIWATLEVPTNADTVVVMDRDFDGQPFCKEAKSSRDEETTRVMMRVKGRLDKLALEVATFTASLSVAQHAVTECLELSGIE